MDPGSISVIPRYLFFIVFLILGGAYFAGAETAFASVNRIRMISDADDGDRRAKKVLYILDHFDKALAVILIGNNLMHIACSATATLLASKLWGNSAVTATTFATAFAVFILAEMIPKTYAKACSEWLAPRLAGSLIFIMKLCSPLSFFFSGVSGIIGKLAKAQEQDELTVSEEELFDIIENIGEEDDIDGGAAELVQSALEFTVKTVNLVLTDWRDVVKMNLSMSDEETLSVIGSGHYSRLPVVDDGGNVIGIMQIRKFLKARIRGRKVMKSRSMLDKAIFVPPGMPIDEALDYMSGNRAHMAIVRRENGDIAGIVTVEDILEELVGEIYDEEEERGEIK